MRERFADGRPARRDRITGAGAGSELTAAQEGRGHPAGVHVQGPLSTLVAMEAAARQLYPETFDADEHLFDRDRVTELLPEGV
jgi:hypothetical protein